MIIAKIIVSILLCFLYICTCGAVSLTVVFPDETEIKYDGWLL